MKLLSLFALLLLFVAFNAEANDATIIKLSSNEELRVSAQGLEVAVFTPNYKSSAKVRVPLTEKEIKFLKEEYSTNERSELSVESSDSSSNIDDILRSLK